MDKETAIQTLRAHEAELRALGVLRLSMFGSMARGEAGPKSDVDLAVKLDYDRVVGLFRFALLREHVEELLGRAVDMVSEPVTKARLHERIDRDRVHVF